MTELEQKCEEALYREIQTMEDGRSLVMDIPTGKLYFKKILDVYSIPVFSWLKDHTHRNIPAIQAYWEQDGKLVVIEELIQGNTLEERMLSGDLTFDERRRILLEVCDGLAFLHAAEPPIIHRDLKPSNIMITDQGVVKLIDYDAAKVYAGGEKRDTVLIGTHGIAAPEQYGFAESDSRTDIYALGKLIAVLMPDAENAGRVVEKATRMEPDQRYANVSQVRPQIEKLREKPTRWEQYLRRIPGFQSRNRKIRILSWAVLTAVLVLAAGFFWRLVLVPEFKIRRPAYEAGIRNLEAGYYAEAKRQFEICGSRYRDCGSLMDTCDQKLIDQSIQGITAIDVEYNDEYAVSQLEYILGGINYADLSPEQQETFREALSDLMKNCRTSQNPDLPKEFAALLTEKYGMPDLWEAIRQTSSVKRFLKNGALLNAYETVNRLDSKLVPESEALREEVVTAIWTRTASLEKTVLEDDSPNYADSVIQFYEALEPRFPEAAEKKQAFLQKISDLAEQKMKQGDLEHAKTLYTTLQKKDWPEANANLTEVQYLEAVDQMELNRYSSAIDSFTKLGDYRDASDRANACRYEVCQKRADNPDKQTYEYIKVLLEADYPGSQELSERVYTWHATVEIGISCLIGPLQEMHIQATLFGGPEDGSTRVRFVTTDKTTGERYSTLTEDSFQSGDKVSIVLTNNGSGEKILDHTYLVKAYSEDGDLIGEMEGEVHGFVSH